MELEYEWIFTEPSEQIVAHMNTLARGRPNFDATLQLRRRPWESRELLKALASYPLMTLHVIAAIHWQALKLWLKKVPVYSHPAKLERARAEATAKGNSIG